MTVPDSPRLHVGRVSRVPERISVDLLKSYIAHLTSTWFGEHDLPPDRVQDLASYADDAGTRARREGNWDVLRTGLLLLLGSPGLDLGLVSTGQYPYDDGEMREILTFTYEHLFGPLSPEALDGAGDLASAVLDWQESGVDWLVRHGRLHVVRPGDTLRTIAAEHGVQLEQLLALNPYYRAHYEPDQKLTARPGETVMWLWASPDTA